MPANPLSVAFSVTVDCDPFFLTLVCPVAGWDFLFRESVKGKAADLSTRNRREFNTNRCRRSGNAESDRFETAIPETRLELTEILGLNQLHSPTE